MPTEHEGKIYCEGDWDLEQVAWRAYGILFPETFKTYLDTILGNVYSRGPCLSSEAGLDGLQSSLTAPTIL